MQSITMNMDTKNETQLWIQISEGGRVTLSFDTPTSGLQVSDLRVSELKAYRDLIDEALAIREKQRKEEADEPQ